MSDLELVVGATYRAKRPKNFTTLSLRQVMNDRTITWMSRDGSQVQYDGPAVRAGRRYPTVSADTFREWASHRIESKT